MSGNKKRIIDAAEVLEENLRIAGSNNDVRFEDRAQAIVQAMGYLATILSEEMGREYPDSTNTKQVSRIHRHLVALLDSLQKKRDFDNKWDVEFMHIKIQTALDWMFVGLCTEMKNAGVEEKVINVFIQDMSVRIAGFEIKLNKLLKKANYSNYEAISTPLVVAFNKARDTIPKDDSLGLPPTAFS